jgi:DNA-binding MarR family transcriptional regulator
MYTHLIFVNKTSIPALPCTCATLRRATRSLTLLYEEALRPTGLRSTQFTILQTLSLTGTINQKRLGDILVIDSTSLTRALHPLVSQGWIERHRGEDRRQWNFTLSSSGKALLRRALPHWNRAQSRVQQQLGAELWNRINHAANNLTSRLLPPPIHQGESQ